MLKKVLIGLGVFILLFVVTLALVPLIFKDKLVDMARQQINQQLNAKVDWSDIGVSAFKDFPNFSLYMKNLVVVNEAPFKGDTLAYIGELDVSVNAMKLLNGKHIDINGIILNKPFIYVRVLKDGSANYNIMKPDSVKAPATPADTGSYSIALKKFDIKNGNIIYDDKEEGVYVELVGFTNKFSGNFGKSEFELTDKGNAASIIVKQGKIAYLNKVKLGLNITMDVDQAKGKYTLKKNSIQLNDLTLGVNGNVVMVNSKNITTDLTLNVKEPDFKHLISLIPAVYSDEFKKVKTTGAMVLDGYVKGKYNGVSYPAFGATLKINKGTFQYPDLPEGVTDIDIDINAKSLGGSLDNTVIDVNKFNMTLSGDPFNMTLHVTSPVLDPEIDATLNGKIDLSDVKSYYPLKGDSLTGNLIMNVKAKGKLSAIEKQQYQNFDASGNIEMTDVKYTTKDLNKPVQISMLKLTFKPELVSLDTLQARVGRSDFEASGELDNLLSYMFSKGTLKGNLLLNMHVLDLNEFLAADPNPKTPALTPEKKVAAAPKSATTTKPTLKAASTAAQVPANIDFTFDAYAARVYYTNIVLDSVASDVVMRNETVTITDLEGRVFDGNVAINGNYTTLRTEIPKVDMKVNLSMVSVEKAVIGFEKALSSLPLVKYARGALSTVLTVKTDLDKEMNPKLKTMVADGRIDIFHFEFKPNKTTNNLAERTKMSALRMIKAKDFYTNIKVADGNLFVEPFNIPIGKINITVYGSHDMTDSASMNYNMVMDAPAGSDTTAKGKRTKFKIGVHGKSSEPSIHEATDENDTAITNATAEQQSLKDQATQAKTTGETKFQEEQDKRKQAAAEKAQKKADRLKEHADQKAKDQAAGSAQ